MYRVVDSIYGTNEDGTAQLPTSGQAAKVMEIWLNVLRTEQIETMVQMSQQSFSQQNIINNENGKYLVLYGSRQRSVKNVFHFANE